jgi:hypothetical protein
MVLPAEKTYKFPDHVENSLTLVTGVHTDIAADSPAGKAGIKTGEKDFGFAFFRLFARGLQEGVCTFALLPTCFAYEISPDCPFYLMLTCDPIVV